MTNGTVGGLRFDENWPLKDIHGKDFLVMRVGKYIDEIADAMVNAVSEDPELGLQVGSAADLQQIPGRRRVIRLIRTDRLHHHGKVDVFLHRQRGDLFVRYQIAGRSTLRHLKALVYGLAFVLLWSLGFGTFFYQTHAVEALIREYARSKAEDPERMVAVLYQGVRIGTSGEYYRVAPISLFQLFRLAPSLTLMNLGVPAGLLATLVGAVLAWAPPSLIRLPCRLLRWPTPEDFNAFVAGQAAWTEGVFSSVLFEHFGVDQTQVMAIGRRV